MLAPAAAQYPTSSKDARTLPLYFSMVVWGEAFISFFLEFCLPSLLAPNNIPAIRHRVGSRFVLHTRASDLPALEQSPAFQRLKQTIEVEICFMAPDGLAAHDALSR